MRHTFLSTQIHWSNTLSAVSFVVNNAHRAKIHLKCYWTERQINIQNQFNSLFFYIFSSSHLFQSFLFSRLSCCDTRSISIICRIFLDVGQQHSIESIRVGSDGRYETCSHFYTTFFRVYHICSAQYSRICSCSYSFIDAEHSTFFCRCVKAFNSLCAVWLNVMGNRREIKQARQSSSIQRTESHSVQQQKNKMNITNIGNV